MDLNSTLFYTILVLACINAIFSIVAISIDQTNNSARPDGMKSYTFTNIILFIFMVLTSVPIFFYYYSRRLYLILAMIIIGMIFFILRITISYYTHFWLILPALIMIILGCVDIYFIRKNSKTKSFWSQLFQADGAEIDASSSSNEKLHRSSTKIKSHKPSKNKV